MIMRATINYHQKSLYVTFSPSSAINKQYGERRLVVNVRFKLPKDDISSKSADMRLVQYFILYK